MIMSCRLVQGSCTPTCPRDDARNSLRSASAVVNIFFDLGERVPQSVVLGPTRLQLPSCALGQFALLVELDVVVQDEDVAVFVRGHVVHYCFPELAAACAVLAFAVLKQRVPGSP